MPSVLRIGERRVDLARHVVVVGEEERPLTEQETRLLRYLAERPGQAVSKDDLLEAIWGWRGLSDTRAVYHAVVRLRKKIEPDPTAPIALLTVRGVGYRLELTSRPLTLAAAPTWRGALIGRDDAVEAILAALAEGASDVVVRGPAGIGKTRLVVEAVRRLGDMLWPGGASVCDLSAATTRQQLCALVATHLGLHHPTPSPEVAIAKVLAERPRSVLVLDNAEGVAAELGALLGDWRGAGALLIASRVAINNCERSLTLTPLGDDDARALFLQSAAHASPTFAVTDNNRAEIDALVAALGGLPAALEQAGAHMRRLSPRQFHDRLDRLLGPLQAALLVSWSLLDDAHQSALSQLSIFPRTIELDAAEAMLGVSAFAILDALEASSWLHTLKLPDAPEETRWFLLPVTRAMVAQALPPAADAWERFARFYSARGTPAALRWLWAGGQHHLRRTLRADRETLTAAVNWLTDNADTIADGPREATHAALALHALCALHGPFDDSALRGALALPGLQPPDRLALQSALAEVSVATSAADSSALIEQSLALARQQDDAWAEIRLLTLDAAFLQRTGRAEASLARTDTALQQLATDTFPLEESRVLNLRGKILRNADRLPEAQVCQERALALCRVYGEQTAAAEARILEELASLLLQQGDPQGSIDALQHTILLQRELMDRVGLGRALYRLGAALYLCGDYTEARRHLEEALSENRYLGERKLQASCHTNLGICAAMLEDPVEAAVQLQAAIALHRRTGDRRGAALARLNLGGLYLEQHQHARAVPELEAALGYAESIGAVSLQGTLWYRLAEADAQGGETERAWERALRGERLMTEGGDPIQIAHGVCCKGHIANLLGRSADARAALAQARSALVELGLPEASGLGQDIQSLSDKLT